MSLAASLVRLSELCTHSRFEWGGGGVWMIMFDLLKGAAGVCQCMVVTMGMVAACGPL